MQDYKVFSITADDVVPVAEKMKKAGKMLIMVHGLINDAGQPDVSYDYNVDGAIESYHVVGANKLPTISEIYSTAASWPERELNELMGVEFEGLDMTKRLFLPEEMLETQGKGQILVMPLNELRNEYKREVK